MAEIVEELLVGKKTAMLLALQLAGAARNIPKFFIQRAAIQLADRDHYDENGNHLVFRKTAHSQDFNQFYHAALLLAGPQQTEGAIFNTLNSNAKNAGAKADPEYVEEYIRLLHQVNPRDVRQFVQNIKDIESRKGWNGFSPTISQLPEIYYNLNFNSLPNEQVQTIRWLRIILLPYLVLMPGDIPSIQRWIADPSIIQNMTSRPFAMVLQLALTRDNLLLKDLIHRVSPKVFMEFDDSVAELSDTAYDEEFGGNRANLSLFNASKLQIAILFKKLKPNMEIRLEWETLLRSTYYPDDPRYILRPNEKELRYQASVETISLSSNNSMLIEGFIATGMKLGFQNRKLAILDNRTYGKFDTTVTQFKDYVKELLP